MALLVVEAPKRPPPPPPPPVVALLGVAPKADCPKEKLLAVPAPLAGWPKPLPRPNTGFPKPAPADVPNPGEPNAADAGAEGAEDARGAAGCPNTAPAAAVAAAGVGAVPGTAAGAGVELEEATVLTTGATPKELLSVAAVVGWVKREPGAEGGKELPSFPALAG